MRCEDGNQTGGSLRRFAGGVLSLYQARYPDFWPTLATEKLLECEGIKISDETLRKWLIEEGFWKKWS